MKPPPQAPRTPPKPEVYSVYTDAGDVRPQSLLGVLKTNLLNMVMWKRYPRRPPKEINNVLRLGKDRSFES